MTFSREDLLDFYILMGNTISQIPVPNVPGKLYLSSRFVLNNFQEDNIQHIVTLFNMTRRISEIEKHEVFDINDSCNPEEVAKLENILEEVTDSIHQSLLEGKNVCVHCMAGVSRSPTVVADYLIKYHNITNVIAYIKQHRGIINPNAGFMAMLKKRHGENMAI